MKKYVLKVELCGGETVNCLMAVIRWLQEYKIDYKHEICRKDCYDLEGEELWCPEVARGCVAEYHTLIIPDESVEFFENNWTDMLVNKPEEKPQNNVVLKATKFIKG